MRTVLAAMMCLSIASGAQASDRYVSTVGSDANSGTLASPFATLQKAADVAMPGDVITVQPGTYRPLTPTFTGVSITRSGTATAPITLQGIGQPVFDCSGLTPTLPVGYFEIYCVWLHADWWIVKGIDVTGAQQPRSDSIGIGVIISDAANDVVTNVRAYGNQGTGVSVLGTVTNTLLLNDDAFDNFDPLTGSPAGASAGGNADGFHGGGNGAGNVIDGCRSWHNSDDGFDFWNAEAAWTVRNSWAWVNGYGAGGNGDGFKLGRNTTGPRHHLDHNVAVGNRLAGFDTNNASGPLDLLQNTAALNGASQFTATVTATGGTVAHHLRNNISVGVLNTAALALYASDQTFNSWQLPVIANSADFLSIDLALQSSTAFRLNPTSDLIDKGTPIGLPFMGAAPDLGAFEFTGTPATCSDGAAVYAAGVGLGERTTVTPQIFAARVAALRQQGWTAEWNGSSTTWYLVAVCQGL